MKMILRSAIAAAAIAGAAAFVPGSATAGVGVSIGVAVPAPAIAYSPYEGDYYYDPIFVSGAWYHGPYRWQMRNGERVYWVNNGWRRNEWRERVVPASITFHNGGYYRQGRYNGFEGAERINARFMPANSGMREDRRELNSDRRDMRQDRRDIRNDRRDRPDSNDGPNK